MSAIIQEISDQQEEARHDGNPILHIIPRLSDIWPGLLQFLKVSAFYCSVEDWGILESIYFITVTICTVGYGDYTPKSDGSKVFTMFIIIIGIIFVFSIINDFTEYIVDYARQQGKLLRKKTAQELFIITQDKYRFVRKRIYPLLSLMSVVLLGAVVMQGIEDFSFIQSLYFCVVTTTTVGYGDLTPTRDASRIFLIFYIPISVGIAATAIGSLTAVRIQEKAEKRKLNSLHRKLDHDMLRDLDKDDKGIDRLQFVTAMLVANEVCDFERDIEPWLNRFEELDRDKNGLLNKADIDVMEQDEETANELTNKQFLSTKRQSSLCDSDTAATDAPTRTGLYDPLL